MSSFIERLLGRKAQSSAEVARERLKLVLVTDRSDLSPEKLEQLQNEIIEVIKRYVHVDSAQVSIKLEQRERTNYLVADIPLARDHTTAPAVPGYEAPAESPAPVEASPAADTKPKKPAESAEA